MSNIKKGDMVHLVFGCCRPVIANIGWTGEVMYIDNELGARCTLCGYEHDGKVAGVEAYGQRGGYPIAWLKKIEPPKPGSSGGSYVDEPIEEVSS